MPLDINITDDVTTINLDALTNHGIRRMTMGKPSLDIVWAGSRRSQYDHPASFTFRNREDLSIIAKIKGSSLDNWITQHRNLQNLLTESLRYYNTRGEYGKQAFLDAQLNGMTNSTRYDILAGQVDPGEGMFGVPMLDTTAPKNPNVQIALTVKPFGRPSTSTSTTSASMANSGAITTITAPAGDWDPPAKVTLNLAATIDGIRFILWARSKYTVAEFLRFLEAETGTFTNANGTTTDYTVTSLSANPGWTLANEVDAAASGGNRLDIVKLGTLANNTLYPILRWTIDSNVRHHRGLYQCFLRVRMPTDDAGANTKLQLRWGGATGVDRVNDAVRADQTVLSATDWRLLDLGQMTIPHRTLPSAVDFAAYNFALYGSTHGGGAPPNLNWEIDCVYLVPVDGPILIGKLNAVSGAQDKVVSDWLDVVPALYSTDSADVPQDEYFTAANLLHTGFWLTRNVNNIFGYLVMDDTNNKHVLADTATITVECYPYYYLFR